jgi:hypothetical protein
MRRNHWCSHARCVGENDAAFYCSRYVMVHRPEQDVTSSLRGEPNSRSLRIGVVARTPPLDMLLQNTLIRSSISPITIA